MTELADFRRRATEVRRIAAGIFDKTERQVVLDFAADAEDLAKARTARAASGERDV